MGTFISPVANDVRAVVGTDPTTRHAYKLLRHFAASGRGRHVVKTSGVYTTMDTLTNAIIDAADVIAWPDGTSGPAVFFGGHRTAVTASEGTALTAAGYTVEA